MCSAWFALVLGLLVICSWWPVSFPGFEKMAVGLLLGQAASLKEVCRFKMSKPAASCPGHAINHQVSLDPNEPTVG